ncbi:MAG: SagB/ThcOx family dehydrogenase [Micropruina sp.]|nr:SagB/ThcOx family dehydrogenase [Micropruina sp.]
MSAGGFTFRSRTPIAWSYHRATARWQFNMGSATSPPVVVGREHGALPWTPLPPPAPFLGGLQEAIQERLSCRAFTPEPLSLAELAALLRFGYGVEQRSGPSMQDRPAPSGGGLYPLELTVLVRAVEGLEPGVHHYVPAANGLERMREGKLPPELLTYLFMGQPWVAEAAVTLVISFAGERSLTKYVDRGYRYALLEAGHVMQNVNLVAVALGLGSVNLGGFFDDELAGLLRIDPEKEVCLYGCALGRPAPESGRMALRDLGRAR